MNKLQYICRQFYKAEKKPYEHYVVTRIWHLLDDLDVKFVTQQYVRRTNGIALTDMFFPQLMVHVEIDEGHHKRQRIIDATRQQDIISQTGHTILRIDVTRSLQEVNATIDEVVAKLREILSEQTNFLPWDIDQEFNSQTYIKKGYICITDHVAFRTMVEAANCFGNYYKPNSIWTGAARHPAEVNKFLWFPKLYKNGVWNNTISSDESIITEISEDKGKVKISVDKALKDCLMLRIVFARVKGSLGDTLYRFKGEYQIDMLRTNYTNGVVLYRVKTRVKTYAPLIS
ncbi:AbaSI family restriction endonuclease [Pedobacter duraquae]|uniref:Uncharacterized protein DUF559 n=1 Tax=Pedobacter duraquae TaxID=425511 RepID=A0A4R6IBZ9_9SPHI|nr:DUF559 domain-containing protein [Pedobacter duraquae]TDO19354.1 uncharacterized protein DUF559 [Pedobacter duraquae]